MKDLLKIGKVEAIDHKIDQMEIMGNANYFNLGEKIEYFNKNKRQIFKLPEDKPDEEFFIFLIFTAGHYYILYP